MQQSALWAALTVGISCVNAVAQVVRVEYWTDGPQPTFTRDFASGAAILGLPPLPVGLTRVNVYSVGGLANIGQISFLDSQSEAGGSAPEFDLHLGQGVPPAGGAMVAAATNFAGINPTQLIAGRIRLSGSISGDVSGRVVCGRITRLDVGGALGAEIFATAPGEAIGLLRADRIAVSSSAASGKQVGAVPLGIIATQGRINSVLAARTISIPAPGAIAARRGIGEVSARSVKARIIANAFGGDGDFGHLGCTGGDYEGVLSTNNLGAFSGGMAGSVIFVTGAFKGSVFAAGDFHGGICVEGINPVTGRSIDAVKVDGHFLGVVDGLGDIARVEVGGDVLLDTNSFVLPSILSRQGSIGLVRINGAVRGEIDLVPSIRAANINTLRIGGDSHADISAWPSGFAEIKHIDIGGSMGGSLTLSEFVTCRIGGDVSAGARLWRAGVLPPEDTIVVGRALRGVILVDGPAGLLGHIVLNANLDQAGGWGPSGVIGLAPASGLVRHMTQQDYALTGPEFGAGSVGTAPFALREAECQPRPNVTEAQVARRIWPDGAERETIRIVLDGPVFTTDERPLEIERAEYTTVCRPGEPCEPQFEDVSKEFRVLVAPAGQQRQIWIAPGEIDDETPGTFSGGWLYRIWPRTVDGQPVIKAMGTNLANAPSIAPFVYQVAVDAFDLNQDGATDALDLAEWILGPIDYTADGVADQTDYAVISDAVALRQP